jgi:hypothetical protein
MAFQMNQTAFALNLIAVSEVLFGGNNYYKTNLSRIGFKEILLDYDISIMRKLIENIVNLCYSEVFRNNNNTLPLYEKLQCLKGKHYFPENISFHLDTIRRLGNEAAHDDKNINKNIETGSGTILNLFEILNWYFLSILNKRTLMFNSIKIAKNNSIQVTQYNTQRLGNIIEETKLFLLSKSIEGELLYKIVTCLGELMENSYAHSQCESFVIEFEKNTSLAVNFIDNSMYDYKSKLNEAKNNISSNPDSTKGRGLINISSLCDDVLQKDNTLTIKWHLRTSIEGQPYTIYHINNLSIFEINENLDAHSCKKYPEIFEKILPSCNNKLVIKYSGYAYSSALAVFIDLYRKFKNMNIISYLLIENKNLLKAFESHNLCKLLNVYQTLNEILNL